MNFCSRPLLHLLPALLVLGAVSLPCCPASAAEVPPLYDYKPEQVYVVSCDIPLPDGEEWKKLSQEEWFKQNNPLRMEFSLVRIDFRTPTIHKFLSPGLMLGGRGNADEGQGAQEGWAGISKNFSIGFDPEQTSVTPRNGLERRPARLRAGGAKTSSGVIGIRSFTVKIEDEVKRKLEEEMEQKLRNEQEYEYDWYLPMQTNEISVLQYAAIMNPGAPPPELSPDQLMMPQVNVSRRDVEDFIIALNKLNLIRTEEEQDKKGKVQLYWNIRQASEKKPTRVHIELGKEFFFALPTQTEWEFIARGGSVIKEEFYKQDYPFAELQNQENAHPYEHCGRGNHSLVSTKFIKKPNCLGIYNMLGNAMEWVDDDRQPHGAGIQSDPSLRQPAGSISPASRGGNTNNTATKLPHVGFRLVIRSHIYSKMLKRITRDDELEKKAEAVLKACTPSQQEKIAMGNAQQAVIQQDATPPAPVELPSEQLGRHRIKDGETWEGIAGTHGLNADELKALNPYAARLNQLFPGTYVDVPLKVAPMEERLSRAKAYIMDYYGPTCEPENRESSRKDEECKKALALLQLPENEQNAEAQFLLGFCYEYGIGVNVVAPKAYEAYKTAAQLGMPEAQFRLGRCYANGIGVTCDSHKALGQYSLAAGKGHANAQYQVGRCHELGEGIDKDPRKALEYYRQAIGHEEPSAEAHLRLGLVYEHGELNVPKNRSTAIKHFTNAMDGFENKPEFVTQYRDACFHLGLCYYEDAKASKSANKQKELFKLAFDSFLEASQNNHYEAKFYLGNCYEHGFGTPENPTLARNNYSEAAHNGVAKAQIRLAAYYYREKNYKAAESWYKQAAQQDDIVAGKDSPLRGVAHDGLALVYEKLGKHSDAKKAKNEARRRRQGRENP